jgi:hypothetical protein
VVSPAEPDGTAPLLEPNDNPIAKRRIGFAFIFTKKVLKKFDDWATFQDDSAYIYI